MMPQQSAMHATSTPGQWIVSVAAIAVTLVVAVVILRQAREVIDRVPVMVAVEGAVLELGVSAQLRSGGEVVHAKFEQLDLSLGSQQPPDPRLPAGKWEGEFTVTFLPGAVRSARIGARLRGGSIIIMRNSDVVLSDYAGNDERIVLATVPLSLGRSAQQITYIFNSDGRFDVRLQPLWQPEGVDDPQPPPLP